jgi:hypothetical protein
MLVSKVSVEGMERTAECSGRRLSAGGRVAQKLTLVEVGTSRSGRAKQTRIVLLVNARGCQRLFERNKMDTTYDVRDDRLPLAEPPALISNHASPSSGLYQYELVQQK